MVSPEVSAPRRPGVEIAAVTGFLHHMLADDAGPASLRSYAYESLSWRRFLRAIEVLWHLAGRAEARDFALWLKSSKKPPRQRRPDAPAPGSVNRHSTAKKMVRNPDLTLTGVQWVLGNLRS